jgi:putative transposase
MAAIPPKHRPHYSPTARLAILELKAARAWNLAQAARAFLVEPETIAMWLTRADDDLLVRTPQPVNRFPEFVRHLTHRFKTLCPSMGKKRIAQILARAGLRLSAATVGRILRAKAPASPPLPAGIQAVQTDRVVTADRPNHVWHVDLTVVPTGAGFWTAWLPFSLPQVWPFCWWVAIVLDHFSRQAVGFAVFPKQPTAEQVRAFLGRVIRHHQAKPRHLVSDRGGQFDCAGFRAWARRRKINLRFGAVGKYGSIAIVERFIRSLKTECTRVILVPLRLADMRHELDLFLAWYNAHRPHQGLAGRTPLEAAQASEPTHPLFETRGKHGVKLKLVVSHFQSRKHLPLVELHEAA